MISIGDKVKFKEKLPDQKDPALQHHIGWKLKADLELPDHEHTPGCGHMEPVTTTWSKYFGGLPGIVVNEDVTNHIVMVRGYDKDDNMFQVEIDPQYLVVTKAAMDFS